MIKVLLAKEMRELDRITIEEQNIPGLTLMENAGAGVVRWIEDYFRPVHSKKITVISGKGNNGGDGFVVARLLLQKGAQVRVLLLFPPDLIQGDAKINLDRLIAIGGRFELIPESPQEMIRSMMNENDFIIDALFGTGLSSNLSGRIADVIEAVNESKKRNDPSRPQIVAADLPSGISTDSGQIMGAAIMADLTVTFGHPKRGHFLFPGATHSGEVKTVDIGIPKRVTDQANVSVYLLTASDFSSSLTERPRHSHKGSFGHVGVLAGSGGKSGAAVLTSLAALRTGAGLVTLATPKSVEASLPSRPPEIMTFPLPETPSRTLSSKAFDSILQFSSDKNVVALGPGLSGHPQTATVIRKIVSSLTQPIVIDADGLNAFVGHLDLLSRAKARLIVTPHPGEMGRLLGLNAQTVQQDRLGVARAFAQEHGVILVLKGANTVIATPKGDLYFNPTGNTGMATAGTGDVLTGIIAGLIAQIDDIEFSVKLGVYLHGLAGDLAAQSVGPVGFLAGEVSAMIPKALAVLPEHRTDAGGLP